MVSWSNACSKALIGSEIKIKHWLFSTTTFEPEKSSQQNTIKKVKKKKILYIQRALKCDVA